MSVSSSTRVIALITFFLYSVLCVVIGNIATRRKQLRGSFGKKFYAGGGNMSVLAVALMLASGNASGGTFLSNPGLGYSWGLIWPLCMCTFALSIIQAASFLSKKLKIVCERIDCVSFGAAMKHRYDNNAFIGWYVPLAILTFSGLFLYQQITSGAKLMQSITGLPYIWGLICFALVLLGYTIFGGSTGAAAVSIFQGAVMTFTTVALAVGLYGRVNSDFGSLKEAFVYIGEHAPNLLKPDGGFGIPMLFSYLFYTGFACAISDWCVSSAIKVGSSKTLHQSSVMSMLISGFWAIIMVTMGTIGHAVFPNAEADTIIPTVSLLTLPPIFAGVVVSGVAAAIHSTLSFSLLNLNSIIVMDLYQNQVKKGTANDHQLKNVNTIATIVLIGIMSIFAIKPPALIGIINIFAVAGGAAAFLVPIIFGVWWKRANAYGFMAAAICGVGYYMLSQVIPSLTLGMNAIVPSVVLSAIGMIVASLLTEPPSNEVLDVWFGPGATTHRLSCSIEKMEK